MVFICALLPPTIISVRIYANKESVSVCMLSKYFKFAKTPFLHNNFIDVTVERI